ncbi:hypothetical protein QAD02_006373 [Eretmocerus hayati]|uniref:Uncharacterized protein n=1 Tax=Eretmocerus hayati TaxID=131215 RepID=A0ACC2N1I8_9HYME|nr:hypothetical protein QAD02_006373 [Eretmocerus hayati]
MALYNGEEQLREAGLLDIFPVESTIPHKCVMRILRHANLLLSENRFVDKQYLHLRQAENEKCRSELLELRTEILGSEDADIGEKSTDLYDLLARGRSRLYPRNCRVMQKIQDPDYMQILLTRFPIYGDKLVDIAKYLYLKETAAEKLSRLMGIEREAFPLLIEKILKTLPTRDLRALAKV